MLVQLSDWHLGADGPDPEVDARRAVAAVAALRPAPDAVLVSGDLADHAVAGEYALARGILEALPMPVHVLPGNHDRRPALRTAFPDGALDDAAPYHWVADAGGLRLVGLDVTRPGEDGGTLDADGRDWLAARLAEAPAAPTLVAVHQPPLAIGIPVFDAIALNAGRDALAALLAEHRQVQAVVAGHVHMAIAGRLGDTPVLTCPPTWSYAGFADIEGAGHVAGGPPPGMLLHRLVDDRLVTTVQPLGS